MTANMANIFPSFPQYTLTGKMLANFKPPFSFSLFVESDALFVYLLETDEDISKFIFLIPLKVQGSLCVKETI